MHTYSTDNELRPRVYWAISLGSYFAAGAFGSLLAFISGNLPISIAVSAGSGLAFKVALSQFNERGWNHVIPRRFGVTKVPDLNGEWEGWLKTSYEGDIKDTELHPDDDPTDDTDWRTLHATLHINQSWRKISVHLETENSESDSNGATILTNDGRWPSINYQYQNTGSGNPKDTMNTHDGTADLKLKQVNGKDVLEGIYYTGPGRGNYGKMRFVRKE